MNVVSYPPPSVHYPSGFPQHHHHYYSVQPAPVQQNIRLPSIQELIPDSVFLAASSTQQPQQSQQPQSTASASKRPQPPKLNTWTNQVMSPPLSQASSPASTSPNSAAPSSIPPFHHLPSPPQSHMTLTTASVPPPPPQSQPVHHPHAHPHAHPHPVHAHAHYHQSSYEPPVAPRNPAKKRRGNLPRPVTDILRNWLHDHIQHPYPTEAEKNDLMRRTGLTLNQISNWFINARRRRLPALHKNREKQRMYSQH